MVVEFIKVKKVFSNHYSFMFPEGLDSKRVRHFEMNVIFDICRPYLIKPILNLS